MAPSPDPGPHHVAVATDEAFAMPTAVTLRSLVVNGGGPFHITVLHDAISTDAQERVTRSVAGSSSTIHWVDVHGFDFGASRPTHLTIATYFRLAIGSALPTLVGRVLYLDVDVIVRRDLGPLLESDLDGCAVGAVQSVHYPFVATRGAVNHWRALGLEPRLPFFNAGVLLIDLAQWRSEAIEDRALEYLRSPYLGGGADQEALNVALAGSWSQLPPEWNQQTPMLSDHFGADLIFPADQLEAARVDPAIVHFQTRPKPWHRGSDHPWRKEWEAQARSVAFEKVTGLRQRSIKAEAQWRIKRSASALLKGL